MSDELEIIEDATETIEISDDDVVEDSGDELVIDVDEKPIKTETRIVIKDEQEVILGHKSTEPDKNDNLTDRIKESVNNLESDGTRNKSKTDILENRITASKNNFGSNATSATKRDINILNRITPLTPNVTKRSPKTSRKRKRSGKRNKNKKSQNIGNANGRFNKVSKSPAVNDNSGDIVKNQIVNTALIEIEANTSSNNDGGYNNSQPNEFSNSSTNKQPTVVTNIDVTPSQSTRKHSNIYDFSKLKWLKPLRNLSSPPHLQIVIVDRNHPDWRITNDKWLLIEKRLLEALNSEMVQTNDVSIGLFDGAKWQRGIKIVGCHNENAFNFITNFILNLDELWHRAQLDVFPITHINRHVVRVYIPPPTLKTELVLSLIKLQNPTIYSEDWKVLRQRERADKGGVDLWFSVNDESFTHLCRLQGEIKYGINRIFIKPSE